MTTYIFTYRAGRKNKTMAIRAATMSEARANFDSKRQARAILMQVTEY